MYHLFKATSINLERANQKAEFILKQLNDHLAEREWLELEHPTIADVGVFPTLPSPLTVTLSSPPIPMF
jgi:glutathione S-transferase